MQATGQPQVGWGRKCQWTLKDWVSMNSRIEKQNKRLGQVTTSEIEFYVMYGFISINTVSILCMTLI